MGGAPSLPNNNNEEEEGEEEETRVLAPAERRAFMLQSERIGRYLHGETNRHLGLIIAALGDEEARRRVVELIATDDEELANDTQGHITPTEILDSLFRIFYPDGVISNLRRDDLTLGEQFVYVSLVKKLEGIRGTLVIDGRNRSPDGWVVANWFKLATMCDIKAENVVIWSDPNVYSWYFAFYFTPLPPPHQERSHDVNAPPRDRRRLPMDHITENRSVFGPEVRRIIAVTKEEEPVSVYKVIMFDRDFRLEAEDVVEPEEQAADLTASGIAKCSEIIDSVWATLKLTDGENTRLFIRLIFSPTNRADTVQSIGFALSTPSTQVRVSGSIYRPNMRNAFIDRMELCRAFRTFFN